MICQLCGRDKSSEYFMKGLVGGVVEGIVLYFVVVAGYLAARCVWISWQFDGSVLHFQMFDALIY